MNAELIIRELASVYGPKRCSEIYMAVMPGVLADFRKMLNKAQPEETISEEYHLDDGKAVLALSGCRHRNGETQIDAMVIKK